jgi:hypothetical protein
MSHPVLPLLYVVLLAGVALLLWLWVSAAFLLWGARLAGIPHRSFGRAIGTLLLGGLASSLLAGALSATPVAGTGLGLLLGLGVSALVMRILFDTTFGKALAANLLAWVLSLVVAGALALLGGLLLALLVAAAA